MSPPPTELAKARARVGTLTPDEQLTREQRRSRRKRELGKVTVQLSRLPKSERRVLALLTPKLTPEEVALRPRTRGDCEDGLRPCPFVGCKHHLFLDVNGSGNLTLNFPDLEPEQLAESCSLDVADQDGETLEVVGELLNITRERVRQLEVRAMFRVSQRAPAEYRELAGDPLELRRVRHLQDFKAAKSGRRRCSACGQRGHYASTCGAHPEDLP